MLGMFLLPVLSLQSPIRLEAEAGTLRDVSVVASRPGFSGTGFVTGFTKPTSQVIWTFSAHAGLYRAVVGFSAPGGNKGFDLTINGRAQGGMFPNIGPKFDRIAVGLVELNEGQNVASVQGGWNYYDIDYVEFVPAKRGVAPKPIPPKLIDPKATPEARALFKRLTQAYGHRTFLGQYDSGENTAVQARTNRLPAIIGDDFMEYSPSRVEYGAKGGGRTERAIQAAKKGQIVTMSWHWNAPTDLINKMEKGPDGKEQNHLWYRGFYTDSSHFDVESVLADPESDRYKLVLRDIDAIARELKKFSDAKVPVLWRPLHEAEGGWFWWGAKGPKPCKKLWLLLQDRLMHHYGFHNLIWVWNSPSPSWYPGDSAVDVVAIDVYPSDRSDVLASNWAELLARFNGKKLLAIGEYPGPMDSDRMEKFGVWWAYNVSWTGNLGPKATPDATLKRIYSSPYSVSLPR